MKLHKNLQSTNSAYLRIYGDLKIQKCAQSVYM